MLARAHRIERKRERDQKVSVLSIGIKFYVGMGECGRGVLIKMSHYVPCLLIRNHPSLVPNETIQRFVNVVSTALRRQL